MHQKVIDIFKVAIINNYQKILSGDMISRYFIYQVRYLSDIYQHQAGFSITSRNNLNYMED